MKDDRRVEVGGDFEIRLPTGWLVERDEEGGVLVYAQEGVGLLHLAAFAQPGEVADPGEELYSFLEEQGVELEEDEVEDVRLPDGGELAYCEYVSEDEGDDELATYWLIGVATGPGVLVFGDYSAPAGTQAREREAVVGILGGLRLRGAGDGGGG